MATNDDLLNSFLSGIIGYSLAKKDPIQEQKEQHALKFVNTIDKRIIELGNLPLEKVHKLGRWQKKMFHEIIKLYAYGFYRWSCLASALYIESTLKTKFKSTDFNSLIEEAKQNKFISVSDYHFLHGLRLDRNNFIHEIEKNPTETDNKLFIQIVIRLISRLGDV